MPEGLQRLIDLLNTIGAVLVWIVSNLFIVLASMEIILMNLIIVVSVVRMWHNLNRGPRTLSKRKMQKLCRSISVPVPASILAPSKPIKPINHAKVDSITGRGDQRRG